mmetsp:Transcript_9669/g.27516  ORF Transcript_9669/g.27516 Transcript_9669/m.27516 type:complete len:187 (+) Transcript_9669:170-730(+)|eukprot:CAMPEP_0119561862 /NCGR_PEP_ID=MMETSP1352-20130426/18847_1 /TAXON_ID=265584 /ORGANISM="Stauroneis constricta, Strain CCMP1120" /LENGTH=186 /DNA_ID=CAMNT_0007610159 /DNA_START=127 /DNA_END=687 /DNA_ORIENTATION=-
MSSSRTNNNNDQFHHSAQSGFERPEDFLTPMDAGGSRASSSPSRKYRSYRVVGDVGDDDDTSSLCHNNSMHTSSVHSSTEYSNEDGDDDIMAMMSPVQARARGTGFASPNSCANATVGYARPSDILPLTPERESARAKVTPKTRSQKRWQKVDKRWVVVDEASSRADAGNDGRSTSRNGLAFAPML